MSQTKIEVFAEKIEGSEKETQTDITADYVIGEVSYTKGGINIFSGNRSKRGYLLSVRIANRGTSKCGMFSSESFLMFGQIGRAEFLAEAKMFSAKKLEAFATADTVRARMAELKKDVLAQRLQEQAKDAEALAAV